MIAMTARPFRHARHPLWVRMTHWIGAGAMLALMASGTAILLALPRLFWGETGANAAPAWIVLPLPLDLEQTGWGRNLHFLAAWVFVINGAVYLAAAVVGGHLRRNLLPDADQVSPGALAGEIRGHLRLRGPRPTPRRYNGLQKLAYLGVALVLAPLMLLTGLTMSPGVTAAWPELFSLFGGRQSARTIHFLAACALVGFLAIHIWQVLANRPVQLMRGMIAGDTIGDDPDTSGDAR